jgi:hypothetical protein
VDVVLSRSTAKESAGCDTWCVDLAESVSHATGYREFVDTSFFDSGR